MRSALEDVIMGDNFDMALPGGFLLSGAGGRWGRGGGGGTRRVCEEESLFLNKMLHADEFDEDTVALMLVLRLD